MRVAHVITRMILGGAQENTLLNCVGLIRTYGDEVLLVTGPARGPEGSLLDQARDDGVPLALIPSMRRAVLPWGDYTSYRHIKSTLADFRPDVVHTHSAKGGILGRAAAWALGVPAIIHTVHGAPYHPYQTALARDLIRRCERWAARRCHGFISVADAMTDLMVAGRVASRERFTTIYSGMEVEPFLRAAEYRLETRAALGYLPEHVVLVKVARLAPLKGHEFLLAAAPRIVKACPHVRFLLVGDGTLLPQLRRQVARLGLEAYFQFTGLVPPQRIPSLLGASDIVVHTSLREGLARVLPQGLLAGRPVVSFDIDGAREVVLPGKTGALVPPGDETRLVDSIASLALSPDRRQQYGHNGQEQFRVQFDHHHMTQQIRHVYMQYLGISGSIDKAV